MSETKMRFCTSCQAMKPEEGGYLKPTRNVPRWMCKPCVEHRSPSIYKSQAPTTPSEHERLRMYERRSA